MISLVTKSHYVSFSSLKIGNRFCPINDKTFCYKKISNDQAIIIDTKSPFSPKGTLIKVDKDLIDAEFLTDLGPRPSIRL